jgi:predicted amidophosphoribosyltransferase
VAVPAVDALAFVPPDGDRSLARGHHPAAGLAYALGRRWGLPVHTLIRRTREAARQAELPLAARRTNLRGAFAPARESPRRVCLVDDVYTSGGTAHAAASALRQGGARAVEVVTFARAVR